METNKLAAGLTNNLATGNPTIDKVTDKVIGLGIDKGPQIVTAIIIFIIGLIVARYVDKAVARALAKKDMEPPVRMLIMRIVKLMVVLFALVIALGTAGVDVVALVAGISIAGVGVGLAMQGVLSNLVAGLTIIFTKPFRVGEYIELAGVEGQVQTVELFNTTLLHSDHSHVVIPNRKVIGEILHNFGQIRQLSLSVNVGYGSDVNLVQTIVKEVLAKNPRVLKEPAPVIGVGTLDNCIKVAVMPWTKLADFGPAGGEVYEAIVERFRTAKVEFPVPVQEVRLLSPPPAKG